MCLLVTALYTDEVMATQYSREADVALALKMADAADVISMARYQSQDLVITTKPDNTPVTDADKATEKALRDILAKERPDDGLVGEEFGTSGTDAKRYWVIDPIDGTKTLCAEFQVGRLSLHSLNAMMMAQNRLLSALLVHQPCFVAGTQHLV